jgi:hypothetical protein
MRRKRRKASRTSSNPENDRSLAGNCPVDEHEQAGLTKCSEIQDSRYLHAFRIFRDADSGCVRFEATARRGQLKTIPIWTAFVTQYIGHKGWMKRVDAQTIQFRELHPYMFIDGYKLPKGSSGRYQLTFTTVKGMYEVAPVLFMHMLIQETDAKNFLEVFHQIPV